MTAGSADDTRLAAGHGEREPDVLVAYLRALMGPKRNGGLLEVRFRRRSGMGQCFFGEADLWHASRVITGLGERTDVYVGVAPRRRASGGKDSVGKVWTLWADCDDAEARERLWDFTPAPSIVVRSGSRHGRHAYWLLTRPLPVEAAEPANRRLALGLGADVRATDAARILRPPGTRNFKHGRGGAVTLERFVAVRHSVRHVLAELPEPPRDRAESRSSPLAVGLDDPLRAIEPPVYVARLLGLRVGPGEKIRCPFHDDSTPSLHVYATAAGGWYCFGCRRGTSIYDLAAELWGLSTRGADFLELRRRLTELFRCDTASTSPRG